MESRPLINAQQLAKVEPLWAAGWKKPDLRPIYLWAHDNINLPSGSYAIPGPFDVELSRYMKEPFDAIADPRVREVHICAAVQTGKTLLVEISLPWFFLQDPGTAMWTFQSEDDGKEQMLTRTMPLWNSIEALKPLWPADRYKRTSCEIFFGTFFFIANGANLNSLQSKSIRLKFNSELWLPAWQTVYKQATARVSAFERQGRSKIVNDSQSGIVGDVMDKVWRSGHQARWSCACPKCGVVYPLRCVQKTKTDETFGMVWDENCKKPDGTYDVARCVETVRWRCECGHEMPDSAATRNYWNEHGVYLPERSDAPPEIRSYWWSSLPVMPMRDLAREKAEALNVAHRGDMTDLKTYKQQRENEPWKETLTTVTINPLAAGYVCADYSNGEKWDGEVKRSMAIDRQAGLAGEMPHRWVEIRAWKANGDSRQLFYGRVETHQACRDLQKKYLVADRSVFQDCAFERHLVFEECVLYNWMAVAGSAQTAWQHDTRNPDVKNYLPFSPIQHSEISGANRRAHYLTFSEGYAADLLSHLLAGRGVRWELPDDCSPEYLAQVRAEHKKEIRPGVFRWEKITSSRANHGWDCSKMSVCFALITHLLAPPKTIQPGREAKELQAL